MNAQRTRPILLYWMIAVWFRVARGAKRSLQTSMT